MPDHGTVLYVWYHVVLNRKSEKVQIALVFMA